MTSGIMGPRTRSSWEQFSYGLTHCSSISASPLFPLFLLPLQTNKPWDSGIFINTWVIEKWAELLCWLDSQTGTSGYRRGSICHPVSASPSDGPPVPYLKLGPNFNILTTTSDNLWPSYSLSKHEPNLFPPKAKEHRPWCQLPIWIKTLIPNHNP